MGGGRIANRPVNLEVIIVLKVAVSWPQDHKLRKYLILKIGVF